MREQRRYRRGEEYVYRRGAGAERFVRKAGIKLFANKGAISVQDRTI